jgi:Ca2+-binding RTX toxin-like protein
MLVGGGGNDLLNGGAGNDTVSYEHNRKGVSVNLAESGAQSIAEAGRDTLVDIENLHGTRFTDILTGNHKANVLDGGLGHDQLDGGPGIDTAAYATAGAAVTVNLGKSGAQNTRGAGSDTLTSIENLLGSRFNDSLTGNRGANVLNGGAGNDRLDGAGGVDTAAYDTATSGVQVSLALKGAQNTGGAGRDSLRNIENLLGSGHDDRLMGNSAHNLLTGGDGNDVLCGGKGNDVLRGGNGNDTLDGGAGNDTLDGGAGMDSVDYKNSALDLTTSLRGDGSLLLVGAGRDTLIGIEIIVAGAGNDRLRGNAGIQRLEGGAGNDTLDMSAAGLSAEQQVILDGGAGDDVLIGDIGVLGVFASYAQAVAGVTVDLTLEIAQNTAGAGIDTLVHIANVIGSDFDDLLGANSRVNIIDGGVGSDTVSYASASSAVVIDLAAGVAEAQDHSDTLIDIENAIGSDFDDTFIAGSGNSHLEGRAGIDTISYRYSNGVTVDLSLVDPQDTGTGGFDTLIGFENLIGSTGDDVLAGDASDNFLDGDAGIDRVSYANASAGVAVSLLTTADQDTLGAGMDRLVGFENLSGSVFDDELSGDASSNDIAGGEGADRIYGDRAEDLLTGGDGDDELNGGAGVDTLSGGAGADRFVFAHNDVEDVVLDFQSSMDLLVFDRSVFMAFATAGGLSADQLLYDGDTPAGGDDFLIYAHSSGSLFYDFSGSGQFFSWKVAELGANTLLTAADIVVL